jgi:hypothetical protein
MADAARIREHMEVLGSDGRHVGTVDRVEGRRVKLARQDPAAGGEHRYLHLDMVASVEGGAVRLTRTAAQAMDEWGVESVGSAGEARGARSV